MESSTQKIATAAGHSTVCPYLMVTSVEAQIEFMVKVFNAKVTNDSNRENGFILHGEVTIGDTVIMMGRASQQWPERQSMNYVYVTNADETWERALQQEATPIMPPGNRPYGVREGGFADRSGNQWWIAQLIQ